ncbi:FecR family protein [Puteibacter caeruleilacunae]|nr:FecR family protein [Puteibacter caeruleilacunae]
MDFNPEILKRFFKGKYSRKDFLTLKSFFAQPAQKKEVKKLLEDHWFDFNRESLPEGNIDHVLDKIHHQINIEATEQSKKRFLVTFQRVAAILIIPLIIAFGATLYLQLKNNTSQTTFAEIQCPLGVRTSFVLPDGTTGYLNSGSKLAYPVVFSNERNVKLNGEAFFDVAHNKQKPFIVKTPHLSTKVLGTQFNVIAYEEEQNEQIILQEGKVEVYSNTGTRLSTLVPNEKLIINTTTNKYSTSKVEADQYVSWTEGKLILRNETMQHVAQRLGRWYNVDIEIEDQELMKYAFRATFINEPLEEVLKILAITAPLKYEELQRETTDNDIYKRRKVKLKLDKDRLKDF